MGAKSAKERARKRRAVAAKYAHTVTTRPQPLLVSLATLPLVMGAMLLAQLVTWSAAGEGVTLSGDWSPGLFAIIATAWMAAACKSWESWRRWIWVPVVVGVILTVVLVNLILSVERSTEETATAELEAQSHAAMIELKQLSNTYDRLVDDAKQHGGAICSRV